MPYKSVDELPEEQVRDYSPHQREVFMRAFNDAYRRSRDESSAFAVAHAAAQRAGRRRPDAKRKGDADG